MSLTGDWGKAQNILANFEAKYKIARKRALKMGAVYLQGKIKRGIRDQNPGGQKFAALHPFTIARKKSSKALINHGDLMNAVTYQVTDTEAFVGVLKTAKGKDGEPLVNIAAVHEYGVEIEVTAKMRRYLHSQGLHLSPTTTHIKIPKRSFLKATADAEKDNFLNLIAGELQKQLFGGG